MRRRTKIIAILAFILYVAVLAATSGAGVVGQKATVAHPQSDRSLTELMRTLPDPGYPVRLYRVEMEGWAHTEWDPDREMYSM